MPAGLAVLVMLAGSLLIVFERKKARGIWFSDNEKLKFPAKKGAFSSLSRNSGSSIL